MTTLSAEEMDRVRSAGEANGRRLAGKVEPFVRSVRDYPRLATWCDGDALELAKIYSKAFQRGWWEATGDGP